MPTETMHLIGAGGQARVVIDALMRTGRSPEGIVIWTETESQVGRSVCDVPIRLLDPHVIQGQNFHVCIGDNATRARIHSCLAELGGIANNIVHPSAIVAADVRIGAGSFIAAGTILAPNCVIGASCIVNHGAIVDHDCIVSDFAHIAPGATLAGAVKIGTGVLVGAGANLLPGILVADRATIGAGAVVTADVPMDSVFVGVPAKIIR